MHTIADPVTRYRLTGDARKLLHDVRAYAGHHANLGVSSPAMRMLVEPFETADGEGFLIRHHPGHVAHLLEFLHKAEGRPEGDGFAFRLRAHANQDGSLAWHVQSTDAKGIETPETKVAGLKDELEDRVFTWILQVSAQIADQKGIGASLGAPARLEL